MASRAHAILLDSLERRQRITGSRKDGENCAPPCPPTRLRQPDEKPTSAEESLGDRAPRRMREELVVDRPFGQLLHFGAESAAKFPHILIVAPLSGMRPEMLWDMIAGTVPNHDVYCLIWKDAADVPAEDGAFGLQDNIGYVVDALNAIGDRAHLVGLCQSALPALTATALLAGDAIRPYSLTLMGGKLDTRINPTRTDILTRRWPLEWYRDFTITTVPNFKIGHGRRVYPASTESMMLWAYLARNFWSGGEMVDKVLRDDGIDPIHYPFIDALLSVCDVPAEFYLDTVDQVFHHCALAEGQLAWRGNRVALENITDTALLTVEGEDDDISGLGQTEVAHRLCGGIPAGRRAHLLCRQTGHMGLFHGRMWRTQVLPRLRHFVRAAS